jgi:hypothetical protein
MHITLVFADSPSEKVMQRDACAAKKAVAENHPFR